MSGITRGVDRRGPWAGEGPALTYAGWIIAALFFGLWLEASRWLGSLAAWACG